MMSLQMRPVEGIPEETQRIARAAFPKGNPYLLLRNELGTIFTNEDFRGMFSKRGQPAWSAWRLALVTLLQFREKLSDRQAADAVRSRIDWKYLLGLELEDPGFDFSVLSEFRRRLIDHQSEMMLLDKLLERCQALKIIKARGKQRTDATYILGAVRALTRLEQIGEAVRAALNEIAPLTPDWLQAWVPEDWYARYSHRVEQQRLPQSQAEQQRYAMTVGENALQLLRQIQDSETHQWLLNLPKVVHLQAVLERHYEQSADGLRYKEKKEVAQLQPDIESPYDPEVRYCQRREHQWVGYQAHLTETCDDELPHLITAVATTSAPEPEIFQTPLIHERLAAIHVLPGQHFMDTAYISAAVLLQAQQDYGIHLIGPPRQDVSWQARTEEAFDYTDFKIDWERQQVQCPNGKLSAYWHEIDVDGKKRAPGIKIKFAQQDCSACPVRAKCTRSQKGPRQLRLPSRPFYEALEAARIYISSADGKDLYKKRAGVEGTISQAVRAFGFRRSRYIGLAKSHLQNVAIAAAINLERLNAWFSGVPTAQTRISAFASLAPT